MVVRIRLKRGPKVRRTRRKNRHVALASAALLTPAAVVAFVLAMWRLGADIGFTSSFAIHNGIFSHWLVWLAIAVAVQFLAVLLNRYGKPAPEIQNLDLPKKSAEEVESLAESKAVMR